MPCGGEFSEYATGEPLQGGGDPLRREAEGAVPKDPADAGRLVAPALVVGGMVLAPVANPE
ncbi:hypothetical protein ACWCXB_12830 [Streptomyces sp. NPDC001514]